MNRTQSTIQSGDLITDLDSSQVFMVKYLFDGIGINDIRSFMQKDVKEHNGE